ncbi:16S rRNA (cytosine(967)-C(5))-methyltransferase RsmB [soil metagenome]
MDTGPSPASASVSGRPGSEPRSLALRVLRRVMEEGAYSNLTLAGELRRAELPVSDRAFATELVYGTLRRTLSLDAGLAPASSRPLESLDASVLALLRMGAYQLLYTRVPAHAAVAETVSLAASHQRGYVNAVLRRLAGDPPRPPAGDDDGAVSARTGLVPWAVGELRRLLPGEELETAAASLASPAGLTVRANTCRAAPEDLERALRAGGADPRRGELDPSAFRVAAASPTSLPGYREGWFAVQDEASVLVAAAVEARAGERILDACAGPGGKATHLACAVAPGGVVVAADLHPRRARLVRQASRRLGARVLVLASDARRPSVRGPFDAVLVDAPCSGLGAARRRPELLWRPSRTALAGLARLQVEILVGVADLVRPGGRLVYSVCTFPRAETDAAVRAFLAKRPDFAPLELRGPEGPASSHRLWPHRHGTDAMFYSGLRRA